VTDIPSISVNMIGRGRETLRGKRGRRDTNSPSFSFPDSDYSPGLGQVVAGQEGAFRGTRFKVAISYNYEQPSSSLGVMSLEPLKSLFNGLMMREKLVDIPLQQQSALCKQAECQLIWSITTMINLTDGWRLKSRSPRASKKPWIISNKC